MSNYKIERIEGGYVVKAKRWGFDDRQWYFDSRLDAQDWADYQDRQSPVCMHGRSITRTCQDCANADLVSMPHVGDRGL